jgi:lysophospholipase L1-like esterase
MIGLPGRILAFASLILCVVVAPTPAQAKRHSGAWREAYQSSPADYDFVIPKAMKLPAEARERLRDRPPVTGTLRARFAISVGGHRVRIRLSNEEGAQPLRIAGASLGIAGSGFSAEPGSLRPLTFGGKRLVTIPPGALMLSDPVELRVRPMTELLASVHVPAGIKLKPFGNALMAAAPGDQTGWPQLASAETIIGRPVISGAMVFAADPPRIVVALGDSITDGNRAKLGELRGWPEQLERRLLAASRRPGFAVVNAGIGGNRVLSTSWGKSALARFDRDVGRIGGVSHLILLEGINDIGHGGKSVLLGDNPPLHVDELIAAYRQIIARAHARGMKVIIGTLTPFLGSTSYSQEREDQRREVNQWVRVSGEPDGIVDFDAAIRDPREPLRLRFEYDSGDHLHPNESGYRAMGNAVDLALFR